jgi:hypothetical protein
MTKSSNALKFEIVETVEEVKPPEVTATENPIEHLKELKSLSKLELLNQLDELRELSQLTELKNLKQLDKLSHLYDLEKLEKLDQLDQLHQLIYLKKLDALNKLDKIDDLKMLNHLSDLEQLLEVYGDQFESIRYLSHLENLKELENLKDLKNLDQIQELNKLQRLDELSKLRELQNLESLHKLSHLRDLDKLEALTKLEKLDNLQELQQLEQLKKMDNLSKLDKLEDEKVLSYLNKLDQLNILKDKGSTLVLKMVGSLVLDFIKVAALAALMVYMVGKNTESQTVGRILPYLGFGEGEKVNIGLALLQREVSSKDFDRYYQSVVGRINHEVEAYYEYRDFKPSHFRYKILADLYSYNYETQEYNLKLVVKTEIGKKLDFYTKRYKEVYEYDKETNFTTEGSPSQEALMQGNIFFKQGKYIQALNEYSKVKEREKLSSVVFGEMVAFHLAYLTNSTELKSYIASKD